jgi:hypothetical protein
MMTAGSALAGVLCVLWSRVETLWAFYAIWTAMGVAMGAMLYQALFTVLTRSFPTSYQARITVVTLIAGFASTVFVPLTQASIDGVGWRLTLLGFAALQLFLCAPIHAFWLRDATGSGATPRVNAPRVALLRIVRNPVFWGLAVCFTATSAINAVIWFHAIQMFVERGFAIASVIAAVALIGPVQVAGRLVMFGVGRRATSATWGRLCLAFLPVVFLVPLFWPRSIEALYGFTILFGAVNGIMTIVRATAIAEFLGLEGYGAISGLISAPATVAHAGAPVVTALLWSWFGGYDEVLALQLAGAVVAACAFWFAAAHARA